MRRRRRKRIAVILPILVAGIALFIIFNGGETPTERAHRLCGECGLEAVEIDGLIDVMRHATLDREGLLRLFYEQFENPEDVTLCQPCAEAVLDAAGRGKR